MKRDLPIALALLLVVAAALALRLPRTDLRPLHGDEAVNTVKFNELWQSGKFVYDPHEYHGPTLYYLTLPVVWLSGARDFAATTIGMYRLVPVLFGSGLVLLPWLLRRELGRWEALAAAGLTAASPAMVFYSRDFVHEMLLVFFTFAVIACGWRLGRSGRWGWAVALGVSLGLMHATKETDVLAWAAMLGAIGLSALWRRAVDRVPWRLPAGPPCARAWRLTAIVAGVALLVTVLLFSAFFQHARGPWDSILTYGSYLHRSGGVGIHAHPWPYYLKMLMWTQLKSTSYGPVFSEALILGLAAVGCVAALWRKAGDDPRAGLLRFLVFYTVLLTAMYCLIPYKTPWNMLSFLHGMIVLAGVGAVALIRLVPWPAHGSLKWNTGGPPASSPPGSCPAQRVGALLGRGTLLAMLGLGMWSLAGQAHRANFVAPWYCDGRNPYIYAHPVLDMLVLTNRLDELAGAVPGLVTQQVYVISDENYWPMPWYLRNFRRVGYWPALPALPQLLAAGQPVLVMTSMPAWNNLAETVDLNELYLAYQVNYYALRTDTYLVLFVRRDVWAAFMATRGGPPAPPPNFAPDAG